MMSNGNKTMEELWEEMLAHGEQLSQQVSIQDGYLVINVAFEYPIELARCDTHAKILAWVVQLTDKTWITPEVVQRFIYLATQHHGLDLSQP
jgi:hypothetical protein